MKRILDPSFRYRPSFATDVRETFERIRRELLERARENTARETDLRPRVPESAQQGTR
jgi:hypothetical protein